MDTDYSECPLSWNQHGRDVVDRDPLEDHHRPLEVDEIAEWTVVWIAVEVDEEDPIWVTIVEEDAVTIVVMIGVGMMITIADLAPDRCLTTDGRNAAEDRGAETDRIIPGVLRDPDRVPDRGDLATKRRVHRRDTRNRGDIPLPDPVRDRTEDDAVVLAVAVDPEVNRDRILAASPRTAKDRLATSPRDQRMTAGETRNAATARIRSTTTRTSTTRGTGRTARTGGTAHDHRGRGRDPIRFTADHRPNHPRDPDREESHRDEGTVMVGKRRRRMIRQRMGDHHPLAEGMWK